MTEIPFNITNDAHLLDKHYGITPLITEKLTEAHELAMSGKGYNVKEIKEYIKHYPHIPHFKNYLSGLYQNMGKKAKANEVTNLIVKAHPDYLFGKINLCVRLVEEGKLDKVREILGEDLDLQALYPHRDTFHISEVVSFYNVRARYYFALEDVDSLEACSEFLNEVAPDHEVTENVSRMVMLTRMKSGFSNFMDRDERNVDVEVQSEAGQSTKTEEPVFAHPEIKELYSNTMKIDRELVHQILALPRKTVVEDLEKALVDSIERFNYFVGRVDKGEVDWYDFPLHALFMLSELKAEESLPVIFKVLSQHRDYYDFYFGDYLSDGLWEPLYNIAKNKLDEIKVFMFEPGKHTYAKTMWFRLAEQVVAHQPERKEEVVQWYGALIDFYKSCKVEDNIIDSAVLGLLAWEYLELRGDVEAVVGMKPLFDKGWVDTSICGTYEDILQDEIRGRLRKGNLLNIDERYDEILNTWNGYREEEPKKEVPQSPLPWDNQTQPAVTSSNKVGRNDPCPCGSGKKYKKCCLNK